MTAIVGIREKGHVYLGADSSRSRDDYIGGMGIPKVFIKSDMVIAFSGDFRVGQLLRYGFDFPAIGALNPMDYFIRAWIPAFRLVLENNGVTPHREGQSIISVDGFSAIIGYNGEIFDFQNNFTIVIPKESYIADGSGAYYALGSLHTTALLCKHYTPVSPELRLEMALQAAETHSPWVKGPFRYESI